MGAHGGVLHEDGHLRRPLRGAVPRALVRAVLQADLARILWAGPSARVFAHTSKATALDPRPLPLFFEMHLFDLDATYEH